MKPRDLIFLSVKATGHLPETGVIMELGMVSTCPKLTEIARASFTIKPFMINRVFLTPKILETHTRSGLLEEWRAATETKALVARKATNWLRAQGFFGKVVVAGNNVHMDRAWVRRHMPELDGTLSNRILDVSSISEALKHLYGQKPVSDDLPIDRAIPDCLDAIEQLRQYRRFFTLDGGV